MILVVTYLSNNHFLHVQSVLVLYTLVLNLKVAAVVINLTINNIDAPDAGDVDYCPHLNL